MKNLIFIICCFFTIATTQAQSYSFIPKNLRLLSDKELMENSFPTHFDMVYYEDGTKTTFEEVMSKMMTEDLIPQVFVDEDGDYKILVVKKTTTENTIETKINYNGIPDDLVNMGYSFGNPESNTVIINTQGGPETTLYTDEFKEIFIKDGGVNPEKIFVVNVHQVQTLEPNKFIRKEITFEQAKEYDKENIKILVRIINYFKSQNKKVILVGMSYGAFMIQDLLSEHGNIADKYLIVVGRLDLPEKFWKMFSEGKQVEFKNGTEIIAFNSEQDGSDDENIVDFVTPNMGKMAAGFGYKRYTELLKDVNLSNVVYVYGKNDEVLGRLTPKEIDFLKSKNVYIISGEEGHSETMSAFLKEGLEKLY
jgi:hypothetical protein